MKIVIVSIYNIGNETGTAKVSERLSKQLSNNNEVMYLCLGKKYSLRSAKNLKILTVPSAPIGGVWVPKITPGIIERIKKDLSKFAPDVVHSQNIFFVSLIALIWAKENNVPYIVTFHSFPSEGISYVFPKFTKGKVISTIDFKLTSSYVRRFLKNVDLIIALNEHVVKSVRKITQETPITVINNGIDLNAFYNIKTRTPRKRINFIYLGSYIGRKNQEFLVRVFGYLPSNYHLDLYGNLESGKYYVKKLKRIIAKRNIKNVQINRFLNQKGVYKALGRSHFFVSASIKEVQSLVIIESLASGIPVVALNNETVDEAIDKDSGLALPKNISTREFAQKLKIYVEKTIKDYEKVSFYCRESVTRFDLDSVANEITQAYKLAIKYKKSQKQNKEKESMILTQVNKLIPKQFESFYLMSKKYASEERSYYLRFILSVTIAISAVISSIAYLVTKTKKYNSYF